MKKIALIEDDADLYNLVQYNLDKEGFQVVGSQTGKGALDLCRRENPDLVILDIMLPDSDGLEICKGIRANTELANTPVIFLTARASETDRIVGLELGANDYIVKPFFIRELIARIKIHFRGPAAVTKILRSGDLELDRGRGIPYEAGGAASSPAALDRVGLHFLAGGRRRGGDPDVADVGGRAGGLRRVRRPRDAAGAIEAFRDHHTETVGEARHQAGRLFHHAGRRIQSGTDLYSGVGVARGP